MSQAEELLNSIPDEKVSLYTVDPSIEEHIIIGTDRFITVPESLQRIAVQYDHKIETVTFDCPRYWDEHDLSTMDIYINYIRSDAVKGRSLAENVIVDETDSNIIHFEWTITSDITVAKGSLKFLVCAIQTNTDGVEEIHWNSELNEQMFVSDGLEGVNSIPEQYPDIITDLLTRMDNILDTSLTESGLAAHAAVVGERFTNAENDIATNAQNIATNTDNIATNTDNIATNTKNIETLDNNITINAANIATNAQNIATNAENLNK